jgi:predicted nucleotidyltransferase component of viral defense system
LYMKHSPKNGGKGIIEDRMMIDALQAKLIGVLFMESVRHEFVLKGGMAMRAAHGSHRYTKDIDLESPSRIEKFRLQKIMRSAIKKTIQGGLIENPVVTEPKQTDTTLRWKINGNAPGGGSNMHLSVEVSRRGNIPEKHVVATTYVPPSEYHEQPVIVDVYDDQALAASKVMALTADNRDAPRDVYDLSLLIDMKVEPPIELLAGRGKKAVEKALDGLWDKMDAMTWERFRSELVPFLPVAVSSRLSEQLFDDMKIKVGENVESWLKQAKKLAP